MRGFLLKGGPLTAGVAATVGLGWLAVRGLDWDLVRDSLGAVSVGLLAASVAIFMLASWLRAYRWRVLFVKDSVPTTRLFVIQNEGIGLNNLVPVRVASEATQLAVLTVRDGVNGARALATLGMERVVDVVASTVILAVAFFLVPQMKNFALYVWGAFGFSVVALGLVRFLAWGGGALSFVRRVPFLADFTAAVRELEAARTRLGASLLLSTLYWLGVGLTAWTVAKSIGLEIPVATATVTIIGTIFFATAVPALPAAVGTFEAAVVYVLAYFGVDRSSAFAFAVVIHSVLFVPPTVFAVLFLPREGIGALGRLKRRGVGDSGSTGRAAP